MFLRNVVQNQSPISYERLVRHSLVNVFVGAPTAAMRIMFKWLIRKSREVQYVNSNVKDERLSLSKSKQLLEELEDDDDDIYVTSIHDRYAAQLYYLEDMWLAKFAVMYDPVDQSSACISHEGHDLQDNIHYDGKDDDDSQVHVVKCNSGNLSSRKNEVITLKNGLGYMTKRKQQSVLRVNSFKIATQPEKYYHSRLILYFSWRNEEQLLGTFNTCQQHYISICNLVEDNAYEFNLHSNEMDAAIDNLAENGPPKITWEAIVPTIEEDNLNAQNEDTGRNRSLFEFNVNVRNLDSDDEDIDGVNDLDVEEVLIVMKTGVINLNSETH